VDGPIEVRNFNRIRKVYLLLRDYCVEHDPGEQVIRVWTRIANPNNPFSRLTFSLERPEDNQHGRRSQRRRIG
jgi:hypothetical protein